VDLDLRKVRYFVALAEQLHFGRAAEQLYIAQPVLSRQIRALEAELKVQLFVRDRRATALTPAGEQLLADARPLLANADAARRRTGIAARGRDTFTVGFMPGLIVTAEVRALTSHHPELTVDVVRTSWDDQTEVIHDGRVDVSYVRLPIDPRGLKVRPLLSEPRVVVVPAEHHLAGKEKISITDLADEHLLQDPAAVPEWRDIATELREIGQRPTTPYYRSVEEKLEYVAAGHGVIVLPLSTATFYTRADISHVDIEDVAPSQVCLAWDSSRRDSLIGEFVAIATSDVLDASRAGEPV
jgi:DNA-binding transcriptional LysR family regulator